MRNELGWNTLAITTNEGAPSLTGKKAVVIKGIEVKIKENHSNHSFFVVALNNTPRKPVRSCNGLETCYQLCCVSCKY